jgi:hypothetical protein
MTASKFPWYGWFAVALALGVSGIAGLGRLEGPENSPALWALCIAAVIFSMVFGLVGVIRLIKLVLKD